jgi:hypothetical protein
VGLFCPWAQEDSVPAEDAATQLADVVVGVWEALKNDPRDGPALCDMVLDPHWCARVQGLVMCGPAVVESLALGPLVIGPVF